MIHTKTNMAMIGWFALGIPIFGQVSERSLRALYGAPVEGSYVVSPGLTITTSDGPKGQACVLTVNGAATERQLLAIFDQTIPHRSRGLALSSMVECMGACQSIRKYERLIFTSLLVEGISTPVAMIVFTTKVCGRSAKEALGKPPAR